MIKSLPLRKRLSLPSYGYVNPAPDRGRLQIASYYYLNEGRDHLFRPPGTQTRSFVHFRALHAVARSADRWRRWCHLSLYLDCFPSKNEWDFPWLKCLPLTSPTKIRRVWFPTTAHYRPVGPNLPNESIINGRRTQTEWEGSRWPSKLASCRSANQEIRVCCLLSNRREVAQ